MRDVDPRAIELSPNRLLTFRTVVRHGVIRVAAEELEISIPTVREHLDRLRVAVGGDLLYHDVDDPAGVYTATDLGREVLAGAEDILMRCEALTRRVDLRPPTVAYLPHHAPLMAEVCARFKGDGEDPLTVMDMLVLGQSERSRVAFHEHVLMRVATGAIAVSIGNRSRLRGVIAEPLYRARYQAMVPADRGVAQLTLADLQDETLLLPPRATRSRATLEEALNHAGVSARVGLEAFQTKVLVRMGWAGLGTVVLPSDLARPYYAGEDFAGPDAAGFRWVDVVGADDRPLEHDVFTATARKRSAPTKRVLEHLRSAVQELGYATP